MRIAITNEKDLKNLLPLNEDYDGLKFTEDDLPGDRVQRYIINPDALSFNNSTVSYLGTQIGTYDEAIPDGSTVVITDYSIGLYKEFELMDDGEMGVITHKVDAPYIDLKIESEAKAPKVSPAPKKKRDIKLLIIGLAAFVLGLVLSDFTSIFVFGIGLVIGIVCLVRYFS